MGKLKLFTEMFASITTCVAFATAIFTTFLFPVEEVPSSILWQIMATSFLCAASSMIYSRERKPVGFLLFFHYLCINVIVLGAGYFFEWYDVGQISNVIAMVILIAVIYAIVSLIFWKKGVKDAEQMNRRLQEYQKRNEL